MMSSSPQSNGIRCCGFTMLCVCSWCKDLLRSVVEGKKTCKGREGRGKSFKGKDVGLSRLRVNSNGWDKAGDEEVVVGGLGIGDHVMRE